MAVVEVRYYRVPGAMKFVVSYDGVEFSRGINNDDIESCYRLMDAAMEVEANIEKHGTNYREWPSYSDLIKNGWWPK